MTAGKTSTGLILDGSTAEMHDIAAALTDYVTSLTNDKHPAMVASCRKLLDVIAAALNQNFGYDAKESNNNHSTNPEKGSPS